MTPSFFSSVRISTVTFFCCFAAEALTMVLMELAIRPSRPITLPASSGAVRTSIMVMESPWVSLTLTASGLSTSDLTIYSTSSFMAMPPWQELRQQHFRQGQPGLPWLYVLGAQLNQSAALIRPYQKGSGLFQSAWRLFSARRRLYRL